MDNPNLAKWVEGIIIDFIVNSPDNSQMWAEPLVASQTEQTLSLRHIKNTSGRFTCRRLKYSAKLFLQ
jgi:hypothetical protein